MKTNAMRDAEDVWRDVAKAPASDPGKASKAGRQAVILRDGRPVAVWLEDVAEAANLMIPVWRDGTWLVRHGFDDLRARASADS